MDNSEELNRLYAVIDQLETEKMKAIEERDAAIQELKNYEANMVLEYKAECAHDEYIKHKNWTED